MSCGNFGIEERERGDDKAASLGLLLVSFLPLDIRPVWGGGEEEGAGKKGRRQKFHIRERAALLCFWFAFTLRAKRVKERKGKERERKENLAGAMLGI